MTSKLPYSIDPEGSDNADLVSQRLRALGTDVLPDRGFRSQLHRRLVESGPPVPAKSSLWVWLRDRVSTRAALFWPAVGCVCGLLTYLALSTASDQRLAATVPSVQATPPIASVIDVATAGDVTATYPIPASKVAVVKLSFSAEVAIEDVTFEVALPDGLSFWSRGHRLVERTFTWPGRLAVGDNMVPIAVRGERPGRYVVKARVIVDGQPIEHAVILDVRGAG